MCIVCVFSFYFILYFIAFLRLLLENLLHTQNAFLDFGAARVWLVVAGIRSVNYFKITQNLLIFSFNNM